VHHLAGSDDGRMHQSGTMTFAAVPCSGVKESLS
jgi:hypothetical protein